MPVSKTPRGKAARAARPKLPAGATLPDRRGMEAFLAAIGGGGHNDALETAQEVMYEAWDKTTSRSRVALARKALGISPLCADAYNLLAQEAATLAEARDLYARGMDAGELALGPEGFEEYEGHFWGFLETRPYMRARQGLALTLLELGNEEEAIEHLRAMLTLNPGDNQGIRYLLLGILLERDDVPAVKALLADYPDEWSVYWLYTRALLAFREGQAAAPATLKLLNEAKSANAHVPAILASTRPAVCVESGYLTVGGADEATDYVRQFGASWRKTAGAVEWLATAAVRGPADRRAGKITR
jgi:tetratricopeptide (TPR) repeat protein